MDSKGKGKVTEEETISINDEPKEEKPIDSGSGKRKEGKNKKIIYYDIDSSSSSHKDANDSSSNKKTVKHDYSKMSFNYFCVPYNTNSHLLSIPLGMPPHFDGKDYSWWSHKMHSHLFYLHPSIWDISKPLKAHINIA
jgi:hypothetical protein